MNLKRGEHGSTHIVVVVILVVVIVGLLGFVFWKNFAGGSETKQQTTTQPKANTKDPAFASELTIHEWGISGSYDQTALGTLTYTINGNALTFSSPKINALLPCAGIDESSWRIVKTTPEEAKTVGAPLTPWSKVGDNYYEQIYPQNGCENKTSEVKAINKAYSDLFDSLKSD